LHDFFTDEKVPFYRRSQIPLLGSGETIVWVMGYRIDNRFKLSHDSKKILKVEFKPID
jgi:tRNA(Ile)-lysidine synthase